MVPQPRKEAEGVKHIMTTPYESGKRFEVEMTRSIEKLKEKYGAGLYHWRIKDAISFGADTKYHKVPCDHLVVLDGQSYFIEDKSSWKEEYYPLKYIREHQWEALKTLMMAGGRAYFAFAKRNRDNITEKAWIMDYTSVVLLHESGGNKLEWSDIDYYGTRLKKIAGRKIFTYELGGVIR